MKRIAKRQRQSGKPVKGERSNQQLWQHVQRMNEDAAHKVARSIATVCAKYPGCVLLFERLRNIKAKAGSKSRRMNRRQANQLRGKINQYSREKVFAQGMCTVEVNPHVTSQHCSRCGLSGERFSYQQGQRIRVKWGNLFWCPYCHYQVNADWNGSVNVHHSFFMNCTGSHAASAAADGCQCRLCGYRPQGKSLPEGHPAKDWQARPVRKNTQSGTAIVGPKGARPNPHALADMT